MGKITIYVVDDHKMFATAIASQINGREGIEVMGIVMSPECIEEKIKEYQPDAILMDIRIIRTRNWRKKKIYHRKSTWIRITSKKR
mgnify:CR=1 FL=1